MKVARTTNESWTSRSSSCIGKQNRMPRRPTFNGSPRGAPKPATHWREMSEILDARSSRIDRDDRAHSLVSVDLLDADRILANEVIRVLIAYGDKFARTGLHALLSEERAIAVVGCAADGEQTLALAREIQPDVLLVDIALPGIAGIEVTRRLVVESSARVLILSASEQDEEVF